MYQFSNCQVRLNIRISFQCDGVASLWLKMNDPHHWWLEFSNQICAYFGTLSLMLLYPHPVLAMSPSDACLPNDECLRTRSCVLPVSWPTRHRPSGICFSGLKLIQSWGVLTSILLNNGLVSIPMGKLNNNSTHKKHMTPFSTRLTHQKTMKPTSSQLCIAINQWIFQWTFWASNLQGIQDVFSFWPRHPPETTRMRRCTWPVTHVFDRDLTWPGWIYTAGNQHIPSQAARLSRWFSFSHFGGICYFEGFTLLSQKLEKNSARNGKPNDVSVISMQ